MSQFMEDETVKFAVLHPLNVRAFKNKIKWFVHRLRILHTGGDVLPVLAGGRLVQCLDILIDESVLLLTLIHVISQYKTKIHIS